MRANEPLNPKQLRVSGILVILGLFVEGSFHRRELRSRGAFSGH
jgi:hypothetical protein